MKKGTCHAVRYIGLRPIDSDESLPACHSERSEESASSVFGCKSRSLAAMKIAGVAVGNKGLSTKQAIFMQGGEPEDHEVCARDDIVGAFFISLLAKLS